MLILAGVIMSFLFSSFVMFIFAVASSRDVHASILWLMGSLSAPPSSSFRIMVFIIFPLMIVMCGFAKDLNLLSLGDEKSYHLGLDAKKAKASLLLVASLITGACVAATGIIGFIGIWINKSILTSQVLPALENQSIGDSTIPLELVGFAQQTTFDVIATLEYLTLGILIAGVVLLVVSFFYRSRHSEAK